jgi:hypothetical protein
MFTNKLEESREGPKKGKTDGTSLDLDMLLTGNRHDHRIGVLFFGQPAMISCASLEALVEMLVARIETASGYCEISRQTIFRLRKGIDACGGDGCSLRLIQTGFKGQYRITASKSDFSTRIGVTACFFELVDLAILSPSQAETIRQTCALCDLPETEK